MSASDLETLLGATARQDRAAFNALYEATSAKLFALAVRILRRRELAEEVVHDTYLKIWDGAASYQRHLGSPLVWMMAIARNRSIDVLRKRTETPLPEHSEEHDCNADEPDPFDQTVTSMELEALAGCLKQLEPDHQQCLLMAYYYGYTHEEIAERMSAPVGTVKSRIRRGLAKIRNCLDG